MRTMTMTMVTALAICFAPAVSFAQVSPQAVEQAAAAAAETRSAAVMGCAPQKAELTVALQFRADGTFAAANLEPGAPDSVTECVNNALAGVRLPGAVPEGTAVQHVFRGSAPVAQQQAPYAQEQPQYADAPGQFDVQQMPPDMRDRPFMAHVIFKLGHFIPFGGLEDSHMSGSPAVSLSESSGGSTVFFLGGGARVNHLAVDLLFGIGGAGLSGPLDDAIKAAGFDPHGFVNFVFGVEGTYYFRRGSESTVWPFVALGLEYEALLTGGDSGDVNYSRSYGCFQFRPSVGVDFALTPAFGLGVALEMGLGAYGDVSESVYPDDDVTTPEDESVTEEVQSTITNSGGLHGWIGISARIVLFP